MICTPLPLLLGWWIGRAGQVDLHDREEKSAKGLVWNLKERDHLEDMDADEEEILKWLLKNLHWDDVDRIYLAQDTNRWKAVRNATVKVRLG
jgi:hypothetical protein